MKQLLASLLVLTAAPFPSLAQCSDADKKALEAFDKAWSEATTSGNRAQLQTILADDFASATLTGTVNKTATIDGAVATAERTRANPQSASRTIYDNYVITCTPVVGTVTHRNTIMTTVNGKEQTTYSRSVHVMEKRGGRWQVVSNAGHPLTDAQIVLYLESDWNEAIKKHENLTGVVAHGGAGNDTIYGSVYDDQLYGGEGNNVIVENGGYVYDPNAGVS